MKLTNNWIVNTLKIDDSSKYYVSYFDKTFLYDDKHTFIYNAAINNQKNENLGAIGIVFDGEIQFKNMLIDALPKENGKVQNGYFSMFVEKNYGTILSCSDDSHKVGEKIDIDPEFLKIETGESLSKIVEYRNKYYLVGAKCSKGYREYKSKKDNYQKEVFAYVFVEAGDKINNFPKKENYLNNYYVYDDINLHNDIEEIATFYIGNKWLGVKSKQIIEATSINNIEIPITMDNQLHHFKGTIILKNLVVSVLDISKFIQNEINDTKNKEVVIVRYDEKSHHTIGLIVDKLGEIIKVPKNRIKPFEKHLIGGGMLGESIVQPPENSNVKSLLTLLNISKLDELKEKE